MDGVRLRRDIDATGRRRIRPRADRVRGNLVHRTAPRVRAEDAGSS